MDEWMESIIDFIRVRQLNIALAALITMLYFLYQYKDVLFKKMYYGELSSANSSTIRVSRSRSCSRSRSSSKSQDFQVDGKRGRRGRKFRRCPECGDDM